MWWMESINMSRFTCWDTDTRKYDACRMCEPALGNYAQFSRTKLKVRYKIFSWSFTPDELHSREIVLSLDFFISNQALWAVVGVLSQYMYFHYSSITLQISSRVPGVHLHIHVHCVGCVHKSIESIRRHVGRLIEGICVLLGRIFEAGCPGIVFKRFRGMDFRDRNNHCRWEI